MKPYIQFIAGFLLVCSVSVIPAAGQEPDARKMFRALESSVVSITDAEGGGSGIVLSEDGLILTNFHVVNTPLPQSVEAVVTEDGHEVRKTFSKVTLQKVHARSDLALLKVDGGGGRFKPARISKSDSDTVAGGICFAMGYPFVPGQDKPLLTITKGIISSARRMVGDNPYIQLDAAINPGNSGGALVNDKGVVIGIPTLKFEGADRIGLAAPLAGLRMDQFVKPEEKKGNPQEAGRLAAMASDLMLRDALTFGTNPEVLELAIYLQREALALEPNNPQWSLNLGSMYFSLQKYPLAAAYAGSSVKKAPKNLFSRSLLAECQDKLKQPEKALENRMACLTIERTEENQAQWKMVMEKLASAFVARNEPARAAYILSWSFSAGDGAASVEQRLILQKISKSVPEAMITEIMAKKTGHGVADMDAFVARAPAPPPMVDGPVLPADISKIRPETTVAKTVASEVPLKSGVTARLVDAPPGVVFHKEQGVVEWTPQPFSRIPEVSALFILTAADGSEETYVHVIRRK